MFDNSSLQIASPIENSSRRSLRKNVNINQVNLNNSAFNNTNKYSTPEVFCEKPQVPLLEFCEKSFGVFESEKMSQDYQGQLNVTVTTDYDMLTVHIIQVRHLPSIKGEIYIKLLLSPDADERTKCKTRNIRLNHRHSDDLESKKAIFDEKFSFELLDDDHTKRLIIYVYYRPIRRPSELLGCTSFGLKNILSRKSTISGWYYLLSEEIGKVKHLLDTVAASDKHPPSERTHSEHPQSQHPHKRHRSRNTQHRRSNTNSNTACNTNNNLSSVSTIPSSDYNRVRRCKSSVSLQQHPPHPQQPQHPHLAAAVEVNSTSLDDKGVQGPKSNHNATMLKDHGNFSMTDSNASMCQENHELRIKKGDKGYGFTVCDGKPSRVFTVDKDSMAYKAGVLPNDLLISINSENVSFLNADMVAKIIRMKTSEMVLEITRGSDLIPANVHTIQPSNVTTTLSNSFYQNCRNKEYIPIVSENINAHRRDTIGSYGDFSTSEEEEFYVNEGMHSLLNTTNRIPQGDIFPIYQNMH